MAYPPAVPAVIYVVCRYCRSCWWGALPRTTWWRCGKCHHLRDARTGHTLLAGALN